MTTAYEKKWPLYLSTKNTILKKYDGRYLHSYMILLFVDSFGLLDKLVLFLMFFYFAGLRTFSRRSTKQTGNQNLRLLEYGKFHLVLFAKIFQKVLAVYPDTEIWQVRTSSDR